MAEQADVPPTDMFKKTSKPKKLQKMRLSLAHDDSDIKEDDSQVIIKPKKPKPVYRVGSGFNDRTQKNKVVSTSYYTQDYLGKLKSSTPATPRNYANDSAEAADIEKDGQIQPQERGLENCTHTSINIPEHSMNRHAKELREIRLRDAENYISLSDSLVVGSMGQVDHERRLQTEDDVDHHGGDGDEGLNGYESDALPLGLRNVKLATNRRSKDIADVINDVEEEHQSAQHTGFPDSSDSDDEWEKTQILKNGGRFAEHPQAGQDLRSIGPEIIPILSVEQVLASLNTKLQQARSVLQQKQTSIKEIETEQIEIAEREDAINSSLQRANLMYSATKAKITVGGVQEMVS